MDSNLSEKKMKEIYERLSAPLSKEAIQKASKEETRKGYDTIGYKYQYVINRLNEVCGIDGWNFTWKILKMIEGTWRKKIGSNQWIDVPNFEITVEIKMWIINPEIKRPCAGTHLSVSFGNALKGAITSGLKKTAALFGVGRQAFEQSLDEDLEHREHGEDDRSSIKGQLMTDKHKDSIQNFMNTHDIDEKEVAKWLKNNYGVDNLSEIADSEYMNILTYLRKQRDKIKGSSKEKSIEEKKTEKKDFVSRQDQVDEFSGKFDNDPQKLWEYVETIDVGGGQTGVSFVNLASLEDYEFEELIRQLEEYGG